MKDPDIQFMEEALAEARSAANAGEVPSPTARRAPARPKRRARMQIPSSIDAMLLHYRLLSESQGRLAVKA